MGIAETTRSQIESGVLMRLGATGFAYDDKTFSFKARIIDKPRGNRVRIMQVAIELMPNDTYSIGAGYLTRDGWVSFCELDNVYADQLNEILLGWDS